MNQEMINELKKLKESSVRQAMEIKSDEKYNLENIINSVIKRTLVIVRDSVQIGLNTDI